MRKLSLAALFFFHVVLALAQYTPATVPNVKLVNNSYVSNPDRIISESSVAQIDSALSNLEQQTSAQVAVVVLKSIGDADVFSFAQELYNLWGIGASNSNGLLILLVEDNHTVRFHTGVGLEGILPDAKCKHIQRDQMVPSFKKGDYDSGLINAVNEVSKILTDPNYATEIQATDTVSDQPLDDYSSLLITLAIFYLPIFLIAWAMKDGRFSNSKPPVDPTFYPQMRMKRWLWLSLYLGVPLLITMFYGVVPNDNPQGNTYLTLYLYLAAMVVYRMIRERRMIKDLLAVQKYFVITEYYRHSTGYYLFIALVFPFPFLLYFPYHLLRKRCIETIRANANCVMAI